MSKLPVLLCGIALIFVRLQQTSGCDTGWFGPMCQFKCHCCDNDNCDDNNNGGSCDISSGQCTNNSPCQTGWFGPACQFVDLATVGTIKTVPELTPALTAADGYKLCAVGNAENVMSVTVEWSTPYIVTWFRVGVEESDSRPEVTIVFLNETGHVQSNCTNQRISAVTPNIFDFHCQIDVPMQFVQVSAGGSRSLCFLHISGGQRFAVKQGTAKLSTNDGAVSVNASRWSTDKCVVANIQNSSLKKWYIQPPQPVVAARITAYIRSESLVPSNGILVGVILSNNGLEIITHISQYSSTAPVQAFIVKKDARRLPIIRCEISILNPLTTFPLCDVEIDGEVPCPEGKYGWLCDQTCSCENNGCFARTGGCFVCPPGQFNDTCLGRCSSNCGGSGICSSIDGTCLEGCKNGYKGLVCSEECVKSYGPSCMFNCSENCMEDDSVDPNTCHRMTGACVLGCRSGYQGLLCNEKPHAEVLDLALIIGVTVGAAVAVIIIVIIIACCCVRRAKTVTIVDISYDTVTGITPELHAYQSIKRAEYENANDKSAGTYEAMSQLPENSEPPDAVYVNRASFPDQMFTDVSQEKELPLNSLPDERNDHQDSAGSIYSTADDAYTELVDEKCGL